jgi:hypothetical protein
MSHVITNDEYRPHVDATNRLENIVIRYVSFVCLSLVYSYVFEFESSRRFHLHIFHCLRADISKVTAHDRIQHL